MKYRKKPVVIDAFHMTAETDETDQFAVALWMDTFEGIIPELTISADSLIITTLEGDMRADKGDYIIRGVEGEFYPCKPEIFSKTYEPAN